MTDEEFDTFESGLENALLMVCTSLGMLDGTLLATDDIDSKWKDLVPGYMADAVRNVNEYPDFTLACAGYAGTAVARWWDEDWGRHHGASLRDMQGERGFDDMDDYITVSILGYPLDSVEAGRLRSTMECLTRQAWNFINHSGVERGTADALTALSRSAFVIYRIGAAIELKRLGYRFEKVSM